MYEDTNYEDEQEHDEFDEEDYFDTDEAESAAADALDGDGKGSFTAWHEAALPNLHPHEDILRNKMYNAQYDTEELLRAFSTIRDEDLEALANLYKAMKLTGATVTSALRGKAFDRSRSRA
jgi:hypothetical protein